MRNSDFNNYFIYKEGVLFWKPGILKNNLLGCMAGTVGKNGYYVVKLNGRHFKGHRVIWEMHNGKIEDGMFIDHIDGDRGNNRIDNLRVVTKQKNQLNAKKRSDNTSGVTGICFSPRQVKKWRVKFGKNYIGSFESFIDACEARIVAEVSCGLSTSRHGT